MAPRIVITLTSIVGLAACSGPATVDQSAFGGGSSSGSGGTTVNSSSGGGGSSCVACLTDKDCNGGVCGQIGGDTYCAPSCSAGTGCASGQVCTAVTTAAGAHVEACVPRGDTCTGSGSGGSSGSSGGSGSSSGGAGSSGSSGSSSGAGSSGSSGGTGSSSGGGGGLGAGGGTVSSLLFVAVGDTRPANIDDTSGYPTSIITKIFQGVTSLSPKPLFGVSTGDYMFATPGQGQAAPQLDLYLQARGSFLMFPAMGNHECTGYTASNCGSGNTDGVTDNYTQFLTKMLQPIGQAKPYYSVNIASTTGAWTAKFVFIAANAWDSAQSSWLDTTLSQATTYTFIMRHEAASASTAPGVYPSESIMAKHPYTLAIVGHTHTYQKSGSKEVIIGNGGAPVTGGKNYGFGLLTQRADSAIQVDMLDYQSLQPDTSFRFAVKPDGSAAP